MHTEMQVDRKLRQKIREKKIAAGHREGDHEEWDVESALSP